MYSYHSQVPSQVCMNNVSTSRKNQISRKSITKNKKLLISHSIKYAYYYMCVCIDVCVCVCKLTLSVMEHWNVVKTLIIVDIFILFSFYINEKIPSHFLSSALSSSKQKDHQATYSFHLATLDHNLNPRSKNAQPICSFRWKILNIRYYDNF